MSMTKKQAAAVQSDRLSFVAHRKLKHHEQKLLKRHDFVGWPLEPHKRRFELDVVRKFYLQDRNDYSRYHRLVGKVQALKTALSGLAENSKVRIQITKELLEKLFAMGIIENHSNNLSEVAEKISVSAFCRRRLPVVMVRNKMAPYLKMAVQLVEQGHVRVGPDKVNDPAYLVPRKYEDFVTWMPRSKIQRQVMAYRNELDDYDAMN
eukprot:RCo055006